MDFSQLSPWLLLAGPLAVVAGYIVMGLTGFGATIIAVPILAHFVPISFVVPMMALIDIAGSFSISRRNRAAISREELKRLVPLMFLGFVAGVTLLVGVPDRYLRVALGVFAIGIGVHAITNPVLARTISAWWSVPTGVIGGAVATVFGAGGPFYGAYLAARLRDKAAVRATAAMIIFVSALSRAIVYAVSGLVGLATVASAVFLAPFVWLGLRTGTRIHVGLSQESMRRVIGAILVVTGGSLLARALL